MNMVNADILDNPEATLFTAAWHKLSTSIEQHADRDRRNTHAHTFTRIGKSLQVHIQVEAESIANQAPVFPAELH